MIFNAQLKLQYTCNYLIELTFSCDKVIWFMFLSQENPMPKFSFETNLSKRLIRMKYVVDKIRDRNEILE